MSERLTTALADRYRIERELGVGGMATVYLAEDLKHHRKVAVKVLKPELAAVLGAERFVHEITTTAALQHPHILPLFDSGNVDGFLYYVMPFIDGETLRTKLNRETQLAIDEAVGITRDVADALDYAHRHGVIHRDIKPENILLHDGRPIVADFGIALAVSAAAGGRMTETGLSLGTPHYMSPEQATAEKDISARSDVYSLASVLYEMLAGDPPHTGGSAQQIIMKIITEPPRPVAELRKSVPPNVAAAVAKALEKLPADRFASARAFADALANPAFSLPNVATASHPHAPVGWQRLVAIPAMVLAGVLALTTGWALTRPPASAPLARYRIELPEGQRISATPWSPMAVSPDGSRLVYSGENGRLFVRSRDQLAPIEIPGTDLAFNPFFSPDGSRLGFMSGQPGRAEIKVVSLSGGPPVTVTNARVGGPGASWGRDGFIYYDASGVAPLRRVPESGGQSEEVSVLNSATGELQHNWPDALPNKRGVVITINRGGPGVNVSGTDDIAVLDLATRRHRIVAHGVYARYTASGHLVYVTAEGVLMGVPFDQDRMEVTGKPVALLEGINIRPVGGGVDLAISRNGTLWYTTGVSQARRREIFWVTRAGVFTEVDSGWTGEFESLALSPDGTRLAVSIRETGESQIWVKLLGRPRGPMSKLTHTRSNAAPSWHPDGSRVTFVSGYVAESDLRMTLADARGTPTVLRNDGFIIDGRWSPDGRWLIYGTRAPTTNVFRQDIYGIRPGQDSTPVPLATTEFAEQNGSVSPDGRWLLYESNSTGVYEAYVRPFPNTAGSLTQVSTAGGRRPRWSRDGREIFFANGNNEMVQVAVRPGPGFAVAEPKTLFSLARVTDWDVAPDGRFIVIRALEGEQAPQLVVVENFFQELQQKAGR